MKLRTVLTALAGAITLLLSSLASAQAWPAKPLRMIVNFPPGGAADQLGLADPQPLAQAGDLLPERPDLRETLDVELHEAEALALFELGEACLLQRHVVVVVEVVDADHLVAAREQGVGARTKKSRPGDMRRAGGVQARTLPRRLRAAVVLHAQVVVQLTRPESRSRLGAPPGGVGRVLRAGSLGPE